jgi:hypothetical protein
VDFVYKQINSRSEFYAYNQTRGALKMGGAGWETKVRPCGIVFVERIAIVPTLFAWERY